jgi:hypothetical protein
VFDLLWDGSTTGIRKLQHAKMFKDEAGRIYVSGLSFYDIRMRLRRISRSDLYHIVRMLLAEAAKTPSSEEYTIGMFDFIAFDSVCFTQIAGLADHRRGPSDRS